MGWFILFMLLGVGVVWSIKAGLMITALATLAVVFAVGTLPFWVLFAVVLLTAWYIEESREDGWWTAVPFIVFCFFVHFVSQFNLWEYTKDSWKYLLIRGAEYLVIGFVYSGARWVLHLRRMRGEIDNLEKQFREKTPFTGLLHNAPDEIKLAFTEFVKGDSMYYPDLDKHGYSNKYDPFEHGVKPQFARSAFTNLRRFWWWPFSLLGWLLSDLIREIFDAIKNFLSDVFDKLSGFVFGNRTNYVLTGDRARELRRQREDERAEERGEPFTPGPGPRRRS